jgi:hypothetical protein
MHSSFFNLKPMILWFILILMIVILYVDGGVVKVSETGHIFNTKDKFSDLIGTGVRVKAIGKS